MDDLLDHTPCGFLTFADDGLIVSVNATLLTMLALEESEVVGRPLSGILTVGARVFYQTHLFPLLKMRGHVSEIYLSLRCPDGDEIPVLLNAVRRERSGIVVNDCVLIAMRQRDRYEDEILLAKKTAETATRDKEIAYVALEQVNEQIQEAHTELEAQQEELQVQQEQLLELNAHLQMRVERESLLNQISDVFRQQSEPETILAVTVARLGESLHADRCYFVQYDTARDSARIVADWHRPALTALDSAYRISDFDVDIVATYAPDGLVVSSDIWKVDGTFSPRAIAALSEFGVRALLGVALYDKGVPVGALRVVMASRPRTWTTEDIQLVQSVATLTRTAIEEARLRARERRIAEDLQAALQPRFLPYIDGMDVDAYYQPALDEAEVGGDFYDVFPLEDGIYALVVADLSGKGLLAASQVATVRHMLRAMLYQPGNTLEQALYSLNNMLSHHELLTGFATLFVGTYDTHTRSLTYVNAGQEPGLLYRARTGAIEELVATGPVLGSIPDAPFAQKTTQLASGDMLALFTDGLTEAGMDRKNLLEIEGVIDVFRASVQTPIASTPELTGRIMRGIHAKVTPLGIRDDVCLLVAHVE